MDVRHLRYFVTVAELLSFGEAARLLHMSQPPLSKRISDMEEELGVRLLNRTSRKVSLTAAGTRLLPSAKAAVAAFDNAMRVARNSSPAKMKTLRIALPVDTSRKVSIEVVKRLQRDHVEVTLVEASTAEQRQLVESGEIDIGVLRHPFDTRGLRISSPMAQPLGVLMHIDHPLANRKELILSDLAPFPLVQFHRYQSPGLYDELLNLCRSGGYVPPRILHAIRMTAELLTAENSVSLTTERLLNRRGQQGTGEFVWRALKGQPIHWWTSAVCRRGERDPLIRSATDVLIDALQTCEDWKPLPRPTRKRELRK